MNILRMHPHYIFFDKIAYVRFASKKVADSSVPEEPGDIYGEKRPPTTVEYVEVYVVGVAAPLVIEKSEHILAIKEALK